MDEREIDRYCRERKKARKMDYLADVDEFKGLITTGYEYVQKALEVLVRRTHIIGGEGISELIIIRDKLEMYGEAADVIADEIRTGKR